MWAGKISARHIVILTEQLIQNPHSRVYAIRGGTPELQGWDQATIIAARTHNLIAGIVTGLSGDDSDSNKGLFIDFPTSKKEEEEIEQPQTLADFNVAGFNRFMYSD